MFDSVGFFLGGGRGGYLLSFTPSVSHLEQIFVFSFIQHYFTTTAQVGNTDELNSLTN